MSNRVDINFYLVIKKIIFTLRFTCESKQFKSTFRVYQRRFKYCNLKDSAWCLDYVIDGAPLLNEFQGTLCSLTPQYFMAWGSCRNSKRTAERARDTPKSVQCAVSFNNLMLDCSVFDCTAFTANKWLHLVYIRALLFYMLWPVWLFLVKIYPSITSPTFINNSTTAPI